MRSRLANPARGLDYKPITIRSRKASAIALETLRADTRAPAGRPHRRIQAQPHTQEHLPSYSGAINVVPTVGVF